MLVEKSFLSLEDAMYFLDYELQVVLAERSLDAIKEAGIRWIPTGRRWQVYMITKDPYEKDADDI